MDGKGCKFIHQYQNYDMIVTSINYFYTSAKSFSIIFMDFVRLINNLYCRNRFIFKHKMVLENMRFDVKDDFIDFFILSLLLFNSVVGSHTPHRFQCDYNGRNEWLKS